jgi:hypothetical protein
VKWLDDKHGEDWAIWEFRAEGTGYPDSEVYNRIYHYPFPDHHPPPFALIPNIMASMRNWLKEKDGRVVVVHCKAGKGRSGTASCSYLISEEGWPVEKALKRFTERRMRPNMGKGVSIPSQLRWIGYVDRWAKHGKVYVERQVEVLEVHCWGLRDGVKIQIEGFVHDGKVIKTFHTFTRSEREIVRGEIEKGGGLASVVSEAMGKNGLGRSLSKKEPKTASPLSDDGSGKVIKPAATYPGDKNRSLDGTGSSQEGFADQDKGDVVFRPSKRVVLPTNDLCIDVERRNKAAFDLTYVTAVAHVWLNVHFEGNGPEQSGLADESGVFEIEWDAMDGIKGSSRKGMPAFDKIALVWKTISPETGKPGIIITEPKEGEEVKQTSPADWKGEAHVTPNEDKDLGLRTASPIDSTTSLSKASSINSTKDPVPILTVPNPRESSVDVVRSHGPSGEEIIGEPGSASGSGPDEQAQAPTSSSLGDVQPEGIFGSKACSDTALQSRSSDSNNGVSGVQHVSTEDLPDGRPEEDMKDAKEHSVLHVRKKKKVMSS